MAKHCLRDLGLPEARFRDVEFFMNTDSEQLARQYMTLAQEIAAELRAGRNVAYLTIGDAMTAITVVLAMSFGVVVPKMIVDRFGSATPRDRDLVANLDSAPRGMLPAEPPAK